MTTKQTMITDTLWSVSKWLEPEIDDEQGDRKMSHLFRYLVWYMEALDPERAQHYLNGARDLIYALGADK